VAFLPMIYVESILKANVESYEKQGVNFMYLGVMNALALCVLVWVLGYTMMNEEYEERMVLAHSVVKEAVKNVVVDVVDGMGGGDVNVGGKEAVMSEDAEF